MELVEREHRRGLGQAVTLENARVERGFESTQHLEGHRRAAGYAQAKRRGHRRQVHTCAARMLQQRPVHRRHAYPDGDVLALE